MSLFSTVLQSGGGANSNSSVTTEPLDLQCARHAGDCVSVRLSLASWASREAFTDDLTVTGVSAFLQKGKETGPEGNELHAVMIIPINWI